MTRYSLCIGEEYEKDGQKKTKWNKVGEMFMTKKGDLRAKIYTIPNQLICVFEDKPKDNPTVFNQSGQVNEPPF